MRELLARSTLAQANARKVRECEYICTPVQLPHHVTYLAMLEDADVLRCRVLLALRAKHPILTSSRLSTVLSLFYADVHALNMDATITFRLRQ